jgi:hypothetical protein
MKRTSILALAFATVLAAGTASAARPTHDAIEAPRAQEQRAPRDRHDELQSPRDRHDELQSPRGGEERQAPRGPQSPSPGR